MILNTQEIELINKALKIAMVNGEMDFDTKAHDLLKRIEISLGVKDILNKTEEQILDEAIDYAEDNFAIKSSEATEEQINESGRLVANDKTYGDN
jgi:hypothetical protein